MGVLKLHYEICTNAQNLTYEICTNGFMKITLLKLSYENCTNWFYEDFTTILLSWNLH